MDKLLTFPTQTEKGIFLYTIGEGRDQQYLEKTASSAEFHPEISNYIKNAQKMTGKTQLLLTSLGAGEFYGSNVNGDFFPAASLKNPTPEFGYKTFERFAKVYKHHVNKDPEKSYGDVALSVWNEQMQRVELIIILDNAKAPDLVERVNNGEYPEVSMGCFRASAQVLQSDFSVLPIKDCEAGSEIISGTGKVQTVSYKHSHMHTGTWYHFDIFGNNELIEPTTEEHPWKILKREEKTKCKYSWVNSENINIGDFVGTPILQGNELCKEDKLFVALMGLYLAEGYIAQDGYIHLTVNKSEVQRIENKFKDYISFTVRDHSVSVEAKIMSIYDKVFAARIKEYLGSGAHTKRISAHVMRWNRESQLTFLGEYLNGDGGVYKGAAYFSTCNRVLARQIQHMLLRCGIISSLNVNMHKPSTVVFKATTEYQIWCGTNTSHHLSEYTSKEGLRVSKNINDTRFIANGYLWSPIVGIKTEPCLENVYNIAIESGEDDEDSYIVNGSAVHNCKVPYDVCSICGNKAKTRAQYCDHLRYHMNKIPPGHTKRAYAINTIPRFFDISFVLVGADRIASVMKKIAAHMHPSFGMSSAEAAEVQVQVYPMPHQRASMTKVAFGLSGEKIAAKKLATMEKIIPSNLEGTDAGIIDQLGLEGAEALRPLEPELPLNVIKRITDGPTGMVNVNRILSTLSMLGVVPKRQEFQDIILLGLGHHELAQRFRTRGNLFSSSMQIPSEQRENCYRSISLSPRNFDHDMFRHVQPYLADKSFSRPLLSRRVIRLVKLADSNQLEYPCEESIKLAEERTPFDFTTTMAALAGLYYAFGRKAPASAEKGIGELLSRHPAVAIALGAGTVYGAKELMKEKSSGKYDYSLEDGPLVDDVNMSWQDQIKMKNKNPMSKMGSVSGFGKTLFMGVPAIYLASGTQEVRKARGNKEGIIGKTIRKYPDGISAAVVGHALAGNPVFKTVKKGFGFMRKAAADQTQPKSRFGRDMISTAVFSLAFPGKSLVGRLASNTIDQGIISGIGKLLTHKRTAKGKANGQY